MLNLKRGREGCRSQYKHPPPTRTFNFFPRPTLVLAFATPTRSLFTTTFAHFLYCLLLPALAFRDLQTQFDNKGMHISLPCFHQPHLPCKFATAICFELRICEPSSNSLASHHVPHLPSSASSPTHSIAAGGRAGDLLGSLSAPHTLHSLLPLIAHPPCKQPILGRCFLVIRCALHILGPLHYPTLDYTLTNSASNRRYIKASPT